MGSCIHTQKKKIELSGIHRIKVQESAGNTNPKIMRLQVVREVDENGANLHNLQGAKSYSVFREAKSEIDLDKDLSGFDFDFDFDPLY